MTRARICTRLSPYLARRLDWTIARHIAALSSVRAAQDIAFTVYQKTNDHDISLMSVTLTPTVTIASPLDADILKFTFV